MFILGPEGFHEIISNLSYFRFTEFSKQIKPSPPYFFYPKYVTKSPTNKIFPLSKLSIVTFRFGSPFVQILFLGSRTFLAHKLILPLIFVQILSHILLFLLKDLLKLMDKTPRYQVTSMNV